MPSPQEGAQDGDEAADARSAAGAEGACSPPPLTGGEEIGSRAKVDWLTVTWLPGEGGLPDLDVLSFLRVIGFRTLQGVGVPGMFGYEKGVRYFVDIGGTPCHVGRLDYGGSHHKGRARLDLSGAACATIDDWRTVQAWIGQQWDYSLTRVDLAVDCLDGEFGIREAVRWYRAGEWRAVGAGTDPRHNLVGDWLRPRYGRTLEIGRRENGKMCRVYEKGRQLGDPESRWVRFEVEVRNNDRDIPTDILVECDRYFVGAYRCLAKVLDAAAMKVPTHQREAQITLEKLALSQRESYGQLIDVLRLHLTAGEIVELISRPGVPRRLERASLIGFINAGAPLAYLKAKQS